MSAYVDASTQTLWAGIMQQSVRLETLISAPQDTCTPPEEMAPGKSQFPDGIPTITHSHHGEPIVSPKTTLLERRQGRPGLVARISVPETELNDEVPLSPPPTHAALSPLPEANIRHAGHTPLIPRALSPELDADVEEQKTHVPIEDSIVANTQPPALEEDPALTGALTLPTNPVDGADDLISLEALDHQLGKIARQQAHLRGDFSDDDDELQAHSKASPPAQSLTQKNLLQSQFEQEQATKTDISEEGLPLSRKGSGDSRKSAVAEEVDGVILKTPPSNFGAPLGQL